MQKLSDEQQLIIKAAKSLHQLGTLSTRFDDVARPKESCYLATAFEVKHELLSYCYKNGLSVIGDK